MIPRRIKNATHVLGQPSGWDEEKHGSVGDLAVRQEDGTVFASAWEPTPAELELLRCGGSIVVRVVGMQPPMVLTVETQDDSHG